MYNLLVVLICEFSPVDLADILSAISIRIMFFIEADECVLPGMMAVMM